jgi:hypothetical protein
MFELSQWILRFLQPSSPLGNLQNLFLILYLLSLLQNNHITKYYIHPYSALSTQTLAPFFIIALISGLIYPDEKTLTHATSNFFSNLKLNLNYLLLLLVVVRKILRDKVDFYIAFCKSFKWLLHFLT